MVLLANMMASYPYELTAVLLLTAWVALTGALHIDGLADCGDAWVGGQESQERTLQIMKDPAAGPIGVVMIVLVLLLKLVALYCLLQADSSAAILVVPILARAALVAGFLFVPYVKSTGLGAGVASVLSKQAAYAVILLSVICACYVLPAIYSVGFLLSAVAVFFVWRRACMQKLGGINGDCLGALVELMEVCLLLSLAISASRSIS